MPRSLGTGSLRILAAIRDGASYGLDIVAHTGLPSGTVYPVLGRLRRSGLVTSRWEEEAVAEGEGRPRRRYHTLSREGVEALAEGTRRIRGLASELGPDAVEGAK
jgi:DNA-binding PadR family transcriptional regulator